MAAVAHTEDLGVKMMEAPYGSVFHYWTIQWLLIQAHSWVEMSSLVETPTLCLSGLDSSRKSLKDQLLAARNLGLVPIITPRGIATRADMNPEAEIEVEAEATILA